MNLTKMSFGLIILGLIPGVSFAGAEPIHGKFKILPGECKGLENAAHVQNLDFALAERDRLAKESALLISGGGPAAEKQQACQRYLRAIQTVEHNLDQKLKPARLPTNGNANMIGGVAVVKGVQNLAPACYDAMKAKEKELGKKEANIRQLCKQ